VEFGLQRRGAMEADGSQGWTWGSRGGFGGSGGQLRLKILGCGWNFFSILTFLNHYSRNEPAKSFFKFGPFESHQSIWRDL
jgi:hypothetical protein